MDIHDPEEYIGDQPHIRRQGKAPIQAHNTSNASADVPNKYGEQSFGGIDRNSHNANPDSHHPPSHSLRKHHDTVHSLDEDYGSGRCTQGSSICTSKKRGSDIDDMRADPQKRYRLSSPDKIQTFGGCLDDGLHTIEGSRNCEYDRESNYRTPNVEHRYHQTQQPQRQTNHASNPQAAFLPPSGSHTNDMFPQTPYTHMNQEDCRYFGYDDVLYESSQEHGISPETQNMMHTARYTSRNQELDGFSSYPERLHQSLETNHPHTPSTPRQFNHPQAWESGMKTSGNPQRFNSSATLLGTKVSQLGSPLWKDSSDLGVSNYTQHGGRSHGHQNNCRRMTTLHQDSHTSYDTFAAQEHHTCSAPKSNHPPDGMEISRRILSQISKNSEAKSRSAHPQMLQNQNSSSRHLAAPAYTVQDALPRIRDHSKRLSQSQSASQKLDHTMEDSDGSDSTPVVRLLEQRRCDPLRSQNDSSRSQCKVVSFLPRRDIPYNNRPATESTTTQKDHTRSLLGSDPNSPIYVDSPPRSPLQVSSVSKSVPISVRLPPSKTKRDSRAKLDHVNDKEKRAAELIIAKEQEVFDKEIFGEVISNSPEVNNEMAKITDAEARQKHDSKENARLLKEEMQEVRNLEIQRLREEAAEKEKRRKKQEEERKRAKREAERKNQATIEEAQKEQRRKMAQEQIESSRQKEIADREKKEQERQRTISVQSDAAKRTEMELLREIAKLRAASLKPATVTPSTSKKSTENSLALAEEEDSLFVPETSQSNNHCKDPDNDHSSVCGSGGGYKAELTRQDNLGKGSAFRSDIKKDREKLEAGKKAEVENRRLENLKAKLSARYEKSSEAPSKHLPDKTENAKYYTSRDAKAKSFDVTKTNHSYSMAHSSSPIAYSKPEDKFSKQQVYKPSYFVAPAALPAKKYSSEITMTSPLIPGSPKNRQRTRKPNSERKEARRKKEGEKMRNNHRRRILEEAEEGGYTISNDELNKRLDAHMRKREENYQKKAKQNAELHPPILIIEAQVKQESDAEQHARVPTPTQSHSVEESEDVKKEPSIDPDQLEREMSDLHMREALDAIAINSSQGARFARGAATTTVAGLRQGYDSDDSDESDESDDSVEDPDDSPAPSSLVSARNSQTQSNPENSNQGEGSKDEVNAKVQLEKLKAAGDESMNPDNLPASDAPADMPTELDASGNANPASSSQDLPTQEDTTVRREFVHVYVVKMLNIVDGEDSSPQELSKFLNLSDANAFAGDKVKENCLNDNITVNEKYDNQLFEGHLVQDEMNSIRIWVKTEIEPFPKIPNFDPELLQPRFYADTWLIRFETVKDVLNEESQTWSTHKMSIMLPGHHYSNVDLANYAACDHLVKFLKPSRPVLDHLVQYNNEFVPELRRVRDEYFGHTVPFTCTFESNESQAQWLAEKEVTIEVLRYQMRGPLN